MGHSLRWLSAIVQTGGKAKWESERETIGKFLLKRQSNFYPHAIHLLLQTAVQRQLIHPDDEYEFGLGLHGVLKPKRRRTDSETDPGGQLDVLLALANLTLSSESLEFLGKSHSACYLVRSLHLAQANGQMIQSAGEAVRVRDVAKEWITFSVRLCLWLGISFILLWFILTSSCCISFLSMFTRQKQQPC